MSSSDPASRTVNSRALVFGSVALLMLVAAGAMLLWNWNSGVSRAAALQAARSGRFSAVEPDLRRVLALNPNDAEVVEALARGYLAQQDVERTEEFLARWAALRPEAAEPLQLQIDLYRHLKKADRALAAGIKLRTLMRDDQQLRRSLLSQAFEAGDFALAEELCRECLRDKPDSLGFQVTLAAIRRARGDGEGAAVILDEVLQQDPQFVPALADRASLYEEAGEPEKAIPLLSEVLRLDPERQRSAGYRLSVILKQAGRDDEARQVLAEVRRLQDVATAQEAVNNRPDDPELRVRLGKSLLTAGHRTDGLQLVESALRLDSRNASAHRVLADYYDAHDQRERAAKHRSILSQTGSAASP